VILEALITAGFFALAVPFGYLSRTVKRSSLPPAKKWPLFLGVVHTPVLPLIAFAKLGDLTFEFEALLVAFVLTGHATGILVHRLRGGSPGPAPEAAAAARP